MSKSAMKSAVITGAPRGIGAAVTQRLAKEGFSLVVNYSGSGELAPLGRLGLPEEMPTPVAFLAGPDAGWINGQFLQANGGIT
jgi:NAD(P)-dependent dehydrogenase (short-subunit alcohol dehydrogenase family)